MAQLRRFWWLGLVAVVVVAGALVYGSRSGGEARAESPSSLARCASTFKRGTGHYRVRITHGARPRMRAADVARRASHDLGPLAVVDRVTAAHNFWIPSVEPGVVAGEGPLQAVMWVARVHGCIVFDRAPGDVTFKRAYILYDDRTGLGLADGTG